MMITVIINCGSLVLANSIDMRSLYFVAGLRSGQTLVQTDLSGVLMGTWPIDSTEVEGIAVLTLQ